MLEVVNDLHSTDAAQKHVLDHAEYLVCIQLSRGDIELDHPDQRSVRPEGSRSSKREWIIQIIYPRCEFFHGLPTPCQERGFVRFRWVKPEILLYSVSVPLIILCKCWIWMRPPAPAGGGPRLVCRLAQSRRLTSVSYTLRGVSTCK